MKYLVEKAIKVAATLHQGQRDKGGNPYIFHPLRVMEAARAGGYGECIQALAVLHDVVEDCDVMPSEVLDRMGVSVNDPEYYDLQAALWAITHESYEPNVVYWERVCQNRWASIVKLYDMKDNLGRLNVVEDIEVRKRLMRKYRDGIAYLKRNSKTLDPWGS
jgi:(p)ppGpp synthase/HD superfamily hydrolase